MRHRREARQSWHAKESTVAARRSKPAAKSMRRWARACVMGGTFAALSALPFVMPSGATRKKFPLVPP